MILYDEKTFPILSKDKKLLKNFMAPFYGWGSTVSEPLRLN